MLLDAHGKVGSVLNIEDRIAKKRAGRRIPLHPDLRQALERLKAQNGGLGPVIPVAERRAHATE